MAIRYTAGLSTQPNHSRTIAAEGRPKIVATPGTADIELDPMQRVMNTPQLMYAETAQ